MSRAYKIEICNMNIIFDKDQNVKLEIDLLPILDKERMKEILKKELVKQGGTAEDEQVIIQVKKDIQYKIDLEKTILEIEIAGATIDLEISVEEEKLSSKIKQKAKGSVITIDGNDTELINEISAQINAKAKEKEEASFKSTVKESLEARQLINKVLKEVYKDAVQEKAKSMGNITSMQESEDNGEYRVRMEIE